MSENLLEIQNLHARIATPDGSGREILKGVSLVIAPGEVHAIMGPNGAGKSTLSSVLTGKSQYEVTEGSILFRGRDVLQMKPEERAWMGIFMSFQYPIEIPGISITKFMKEAVNSKRKANGMAEMGAGEFLKFLREKMAMLKIDPSFAKRDVNVGFSGGEKKKCEIFQMAALEPVLSILDETDSGLDVDALKTVSDGVNALRSAERSTIVITHYRRLLEYIVPDVVHVLKDGAIVKTGDKSLVDFIENNGYDAIK